MMTLVTCLLCQLCHLRAILGDDIGDMSVVSVGVSTVCHTR